MNSGTDPLQCLRDLTKTLEDAFHYFHKGPNAGSQQQPQVSLSVGEANEVMGLLLGLMNSMSTVAPGTQQSVVSATLEESTFQVLSAYISQPLIFSPDVVQGHSVQQTFVSLRITALQTVNAICVEASKDPTTSTKCVRAFEEHRLLGSLISLLSSPATFEALRAASVESIFVFVLRVPGSRSHVFSTHTHQSLVNCLVLEPAMIVRNYICATLRELAVDHAHEIAEPTILNACLKLIPNDDSPDVRSMCLEILDQCLQANTRVGGFLEKPDELCTVLRERLENDQNDQVILTVGKLTENCFHAAMATGIPNLLEYMAMNHGYKSLILGLRHSPAAATAVARALRYQVQYTPSHLQLGYHIVTQFQSLSALLKCAMDLAQNTGTNTSAGGGIAATPMGDAAQNSPNGAAIQTLAVELGLTISLILAQSPVNRQHLYRELNAFPLWSSSLRSAVVNFLNSAALDYFCKIDLVDVTGSHINMVHTVEWGDGMKPKKASIRAVYAQQEQRVREQKMERPSAIPPIPEHEERRRAKLTFVLLNYAVHLSLAPEEAGGGGQASAGVTAAPTTPNRAAGGPAMMGSPDGGMNTTVNGSTFIGATGQSPVAGVPFHYSAAGGGQSPRAGMSPSRATGRGPMFPSAHSPRAGGQQPGANDSILTARTHKERREAAIAYDKFDSSFKMVMEFSEYYSKQQKQPTVYEPTSDGFVVRKEKLLNPWGNVVKKPQRLKSWAVQDMKDGDLFYFAIPFDDLKLFALETVLDRARRQIGVCKKAFITTPQVARGRRWFLHDMMTNVMPKAIDCLTELKAHVEKQGGDNVRFPLFLFREKEMHMGERALHPGNLKAVTEQIRFYFSQNPGEMLGVDPEYVTKVEEQIRSLSQRRYAAGDNLDDLPDVGYDDDDGDAFRGHGGLSSDSDNE